MLENLTRHPERETEALYRSVAGALQRDPGDTGLQGWWQEALQTYRAPAFAELFDPRRHEQAFSEVPVQYLDGDRLVYGIIDRLVLLPGRVLVIDYKTHLSATAETIPGLVEQYREQLRLYAGAAARLWPGREIQPRLLFTACGSLVATGQHDSYRD
jgi:ATP-dependent helicase/nuclease subunit A